MIDYMKMHCSEIYCFQILLIKLELGYCSTVTYNGFYMYINRVLYPITILISHLDIAVIVCQCVAVNIWSETTYA